jgi:hypothetical protein
LHPLGRSSRTPDLRLEIRDTWLVSTADLAGVHCRADCLLMRRSQHVLSHRSDQCQESMLGESKWAFYQQVHVHGFTSGHKHL